jgi:nucleolar protein 15
VYIGRLPRNFSEEPLRKFLSQFGTITRLRLSRNKYTGASKHYAFVQFEDKEVASIVAETMNKYLLSGHVLRCKLLDKKDVHENLWKGAVEGTNKPVPFKVLPRATMHAEQVNRKRSAEEDIIHDDRLLRSEDAKRRKIAQAGIEYDFSGYAGKQVQVQVKKQHSSHAHAHAHDEDGHGKGQEESKKKQKKAKSEAAADSSTKSTKSTKATKSK